MIMQSSYGATVVVPPRPPAHCPCCPDKTPLSWRHQLIIDWLADGKTSEQIAAHLHISDNTFNGHVTDLHHVLDVSSRYEAVAVCLATWRVTRCRKGRHQVPDTDPSTAVRLTHHEISLLPDIGAGKRNRQIAAAHGISVRGASRHVTNIAHVLRARNRCHLISILHDLGYVPPRHATPAAVPSDTTSEEV